MVEVFPQPALGTAPVALDELALDPVELDWELAMEAAKLLPDPAPDPELALCVEAPRDVAPELDVLPAFDDVPLLLDGPPAAPLEGEEVAEAELGRTPLEALDVDVWLFMVGAGAGPLELLPHAIARRPRTTKR